ncbi:MAG: hypothetical protein A2W25_15580 [candidate division Zixibacteria bacterium RBG_16_53_22]|nr:MAG: hypothetical protein A2W25_15580 [candidate division Zixibacteria bacterium RBG_16_53_22]
MSKVLPKSAILVLLLAVINAPLAQWPSDPAQNLIVSNMSGEETISKIAPMSDGGCYVSWWNNTAGMYWFYLQRYDATGIAQWADDGLLISNHAQDTWLTDYDLAVDSADHAIIAINDLRAGGDWDIYAYRISPTGTFVWGANGVTVCDNGAADYTPRAIVTSTGNIVITWQDDTNIYVCKYSPDGLELWPMITMSATYALSIPSLAAVESDGFILQMLVAQGPNYYNPKHLYAQKFDSAGIMIWPGSNGVVVQNAGGFGPQMRPDIESDGAGGAYSFWYDSRSTVLHAFAQHILSAGSMAWTANGVVVSTTAGHLQMSPACVPIPSTGDLTLFYENTNSDQTMSGLYGQKFNSAGVRQWGNGGIAFVPLTEEPKMLVRANRVENDAVVTYLENPPGNFVMDYLMAIRVDGLGSHVWDPSPVTMASTLSDKGYHSACATVAGQAIAAWQDKRVDPDGDIYLQNINADGTFGPTILPLTAFDLLSPPDGAELDSCSPYFIWSSSTDPTPGYPVSYQVFVDSMSDFSNPFPVSDTISDTAWACPACLLNNTYYWKVAAFNGHAPDRFCNQIFEFTIHQTPSGCVYIPGDINGVGGPNGIDVTYGVSFLKGGNAPPADCGTPVGPCPQNSPFYAAGDVNGSCSFNGIDITYFVAYLKGLQPALLFCPTCPPAQQAKPGGSRT